MYHSYCGDQILKVDTRSQIMEKVANIRFADECDKKGIPIFIDKCFPPATVFFNSTLLNFQAFNVKNMDRQKVVWV